MQNSLVVINDAKNNTNDRTSNFMTLQSITIEHSALETKSTPPTREPIPEPFIATFQEIFHESSLAKDSQTKSSDLPDNSLDHLAVESDNQALGSSPSSVNNFGDHTEEFSSSLSAELTSVPQHTEELEESIIISKAKNFIINKQNDEFKALFDEHQEEILNHIIIDHEKDCSFTFLIFSLYHQNTEAFMIMFDAEKTKDKSESKIYNAQDNFYKIIFYSVFYDNHDVFDALVDFDKELLSNNIDLVLFAIRNEKADFVGKILTLCEEAKDYKSQGGSSFVEFAIYYHNIDVLKEILTAVENSANTTNEFIYDFIYNAICGDNFEAFKLILEKYPHSINASHYEQDLLIWSLLTVYEGIIQLEFNDGSIDESESQKIITAIDNQKKILGLIFKTKFDLTEDSFDQNFETLIDFYSKKVHLELGYSDMEEVGMHNLTFLKLYKEKILEIAQTLQEEDIRESKQDIENSRLFLDLALQAVDFATRSISFESGDQKINIYNLRLSDHASYFIFYSDKETKKLTHIALCDNWEIFESDKWKESSEYVGGIRKFKVEAEIEATEEFFKNFIKSNSKKKAMDEFHKNIREKGLVDHENNVIISVEDLKKPELSIKTRKRSRGNCNYKSFKILCRYVANYLDDRFVFSQENGEHDLLSVPKDERLEMLDKESLSKEDEKSISAESSSNEKQIINGDMIFKKFKKYLTINAIKSLIKFHDKVEQKLKDPEIDESHKKFNEYLKSEIETLFDKARKKAEKKIELNKSNPHDLRIHQEILEQLSFPKTNINIRNRESVLGKRSR